MEKNKPIIWTYYHPLYQKEILSRPHSKTAYSAFGEIITKTDISILFSDGCIFDIHLKKGRLKFYVDLTSILASGHHDLLKESLSQYYDDTSGQQFPSIHQVIRPYILSGDKNRSLRKAKEYYEKTRPQTRKEEFPDWLIIFLAVTLDNKKQALDYLKVEEKSNINFGHGVLPRCRMLLFQNDHKAKSRLKNETAKARSVNSWVSCATAWKQLFNDDNEARICLHNAKTSPDNDQNWEYYADAYKQIFNDDQESLSIIHNHEKNAKNAREYSICARLWMKLFGDKKSAKRCLLQMEAATKSSGGTPSAIYNNAHSVAWFWISLLGNKNKAREWALEAEKAISKMEPYYRIGAWERLSQFYNSALSDSAEHERCYKIYEEEYDEFFD